MLNLQIGWEAFGGWWTIAWGPLQWLLGMAPSQLTPLRCWKRRRWGLAHPRRRRTSTRVVSVLGHHQNPMVDMPCSVLVTCPLNRPWDWSKRILRSGWMRTFQHVTEFDEEVSYRTKMWLYGTSTSQLWNWNWYENLRKPSGITNYNCHEGGLVSRSLVLHLEWPNSSIDPVKRLARFQPGMTFAPPFCFRCTVMGRDQVTSIESITTRMLPSQTLPCRIMPGWQINSNISSRG